jgi:hypothetical protein
MDIASWSRILKTIHINQENISMDHREVLDMCFRMVEGISSDVCNVVVHPLEKKEIQELKNVFGTRFKNYKMGRISRGSRTDDAYLKCHYSEQHKMAMIERLNGKQYHCVGQSSRHIPNQECTHKHFIWIGHGRMEHFSVLERKKWIFDHYYQRKDIYKSMSHAMEIAVTKDILHNYIKSKAPRKTTIQERCGYAKNRVALITKKKVRTIDDDRFMRTLDIYVDIDRYIDDLYGENIYIRCFECDTMGSSSKHHPVYDSLRYVRS